MTQDQLWVNKGLVWVMVTQGFIIPVCLLFLYLFKIFHKHSLTSTKLLTSIAANDSSQNEHASLNRGIKARNWYEWRKYCDMVLRLNWKLLISLQVNSRNFLFTLIVWAEYDVFKSSVVWGDKEGEREGEKEEKSYCFLSKLQMSRPYSIRYMVRKLTSTYQHCIPGLLG